MPARRWARSSPARWRWLFYLRLLLRRRIIFSLDLRAALRLPAAVVRAFALKAVPLIANEILWNVGMNVYFWSYARLDEAALPAVTIGEQISTIAAVLAMGTSSTVSVLIGAELGAGRLGQAKSNCKKLLTLVAGIGLLCAGLCLALGAVLPNAFGVTPQLRGLASRIATIMGLCSPFNFLYGFCFYCMRTGGDTRSAMLLDSGYMWLLPVPASLLMALLLPGRLDIASAVLIVQVLMNLKVLPALGAQKGLLGAQHHRLTLRVCAWPALHFHALRYNNRLQVEAALSTDAREKGVENAPCVAAGRKR